jgi:hypothetical protein
VIYLFGSVGVSTRQFLLGSASMHPQPYLAPPRRFERSFTSPDLNLPFSLNGYFPDEEDSSLSDGFSQRNMLDSFNVGHSIYS